MTVRDHRCSIANIGNKKAAVAPRLVLISTRKYHETLGKYLSRGNFAGGFLNRAGQEMQKDGDDSLYGIRYPFKSFLRYVLA